MGGSLWVELHTTLFYLMVILLNQTFGPFLHNENLAHLTFYPHYTCSYKFRTQAYNSSNPLEILSTNSSAVFFNQPWSSDLIPYQASSDTDYRGAHHVVRSPHRDLSSDPRAPRPGRFIARQPSVWLSSIELVKRNIVVLLQGISHSRCPRLLDWEHGIKSGTLEVIFAVLLSQFSRLTDSIIGLELSISSMHTGKDEYF